jgi:hypothetical protein
MADFCNICSEKMGMGEGEIIIEDIFNELKTEHFLQVLCEGCTMCAIAKDKDNKLLLLSIKEQDKWLNEKDFFEKHGNYI